ncbi:MAG TPA: HIT family protein [Acidimicrobiia bacterium]|nr:HIT family protein [Acidimicrobiia bacterium]
MPVCAFCEIVTGDRPADMVLDEDGFVAFLDIRPVFPGHCLLVPRVHVVTLEDLPADLDGLLTATAKRLTTAVRVGVGAQGTFVAINNTVSQSVPHLHVHVVPRTTGDGLRGFFWPRTGYESDAHREQIRGAIASALPG